MSRRAARTPAPQDRAGALARRIAALARTLSPEAVAAELGLDPEEVAETLERLGHPVPRAPWDLRCDRTGRVWTARSAGGAYRLAQQLGLVEWRWRPAGRGAWR